MQEAIESSSIYQAVQHHVNTNNFFLPYSLAIEEQRDILRCVNFNQAIYFCIQNQCIERGLMCRERNCQCKNPHNKCHHVSVDRVLESISSHRKEIPESFKETFKIACNDINQMIEKLSDLRSKFQKQQHYFGLRQQQIYLVDLIYDKKIDLINGKIINSLEKTFDTEIQLKQITKQQAIRDFESKKKDFDEMCQSIEKKYFQTSNKITSSQEYNLKLFSDSKILTTGEQINLLEKWISQEKEKIIKSQQLASPSKQLTSQLLFRASQYNFKANQFHRLCDNKKNLFVIIKNEFNKIIGGFTVNAWKKSICCQSLKDENKKAFLFSLNTKEKYSCIKSQDSISYLSKYGPRFGGTGDADLVIDDNCQLNTGSYGNLGSCYNLKINQKSFKYSQKNQQTYTLWTGNKNNRNFKVIQYQVYQIKNLFEQ